jgi:hypothetical protein
MQEHLVGSLTAGEERLEVPECGQRRMPPYQVGQRSTRLERVTQLIDVVADFHAEDRFFGLPGRKKKPDGFGKRESPLIHDRPVEKAIAPGDAGCGRKSSMFIPWNSECLFISGKRQDGGSQ